MPRSSAGENVGSSMVAVHRKMEAQRRMTKHRHEIVNKLVQGHTNGTLKVVQPKSSSMNALSV